eukprot:463007-Pyramimonas_sp.AAC.1
MFQPRGFTLSSASATWSSFTRWSTAAESHTRLKLQWKISLISGRPQKLSRRSRWGDQQRP